MKKIAIIGGGIGGLTLANSFQNLGIEYQLFESASAFGDVGAGIGTSETTLEVFSKLGLKEDLMKKGSLINYAVIVDEDMNTIKRMPKEINSFCIHRSYLIDVISQNIDMANVSFNHRLIDIAVNENTNTLTFENGIEYEFDTVVACDGINSLIRRKLFPDIKKRYSGQTIWRGIAKCSFPEKFNKTYYEFWGHNLRFAIIPSGDNEYFWYAVKPSKPDEHDDPTTIKEELKRLFKNFIPEVSIAIDSSPQFIRNDMWDLIPENRLWHYKNIVFVGDAIHATTPNLAQGGCQAIEDSYTLSLIIKKYGANQKAFEKYKNLRIKKVNMIVKQSWSYGKIAHQSNFLKKIAVRFLFKYVLPNSYFKNLHNKLIDLKYLKKI